MRFDDHVTIATPEGVELELTLAGVGSRFVATVIDSLLQLVVIIALGLAFRGLDVFGELGTGFGTAAYVLGTFVVLFGYHVFFEVVASGRPPGKRWTGLRVVRTGGHPVTFTASAVRNVVRLVDFLPGYYVLGAIVVILSPRNQRLGDLAAGTLVVRDKLARPRAWTPSPFASVPVDVGAWDVSAVTPEEIATVRQFLERRDDVTDEARAQLADELATRLRPKVGGVADDMRPERFLEALAAAKAARG